MSGPTPGPWRAIPPGADGSQFLNWIVGSDAPPEIDGGSKMLVSVMAPHATAYSEADARLISAGPDLLAALVMIRDADNDCRRDDLPTIPAAARAKIDAAIAKATGVAP